MRAENHTNTNFLEGWLSGCDWFGQLIPSLGSLSGQVQKAVSSAVISIQIYAL